MAVAKTVIQDYRRESAHGQPPVVFFPFIYQDVIRIVDTLGSHYDVIVNLMHMKKGERLRVIDFICGYAYAFGLEKELLEPGVYLFGWSKESTASASGRAEE